MRSFDPRAARRVAEHVATAGFINPSPDVGRAVALRWHERSLRGAYDQRASLEDAVNLSSLFCATNGVTIPAFAVNDTIKSSGLATKWQGDRYLVQVNRPACKSPCDLWWPGWREDATIAGVVAHETGHVSHWSMTNWSAFTRRWEHSAQTIEAPVSSYEPNPSESIAESMRLFIMNPTLLEELWPIRYAMLAERFTPVVKTHWRVILGTSSRHLTEAELMLTRAT